MIRKRILFFLLGLSVVSPGVIAGHSLDATHSLVTSDNVSDNPSFGVREDKDFSVSPLPCTPSSSANTLNRMNQNQNRGVSMACDSDWVQWVRLSSGINIDWLKLGNTSSKFMGINYQRFSLNDVYLNLAAEINPWAHAFVSLSYDTTTIEDNRVDPNAADPSVYRTEYSSAYSDNATGGQVQALRFEQAYVRFSNFTESPVFLQVGKQFQDFSRYTLHPITRSLTQSLSEVLVASAKLGVILPNGLYGSITMFDDVLQENRLLMDGYLHTNKKNTPLNYSLALGYDQQKESWGGQIGMSWIRNLIAANDMAYRVAQSYSLARGAFTGVNRCSFCYQHRAGGLALYGDIRGGLLTFHARYTRALKRLTVLDLPEHLTPDYTNRRILNNLRGAKPWAMGIQLGYCLDGVSSLSSHQRIYIGYQASRETVSLALPKYRWVLGYTVSPIKNTEFVLEWDRDKDFSAQLGGSGKHYNLVTLRSSVKFS